MILSDVLPQYFSTSVKLRSARTRRHYERSIRQFDEFLGRPATLGDLTDDQAIGFMLATVNQGLSPITANQRVKQLRAFWTWAARKRLVNEFPTFAQLDEPEPQPIAYTMAQVHQLFAHCGKQSGYIGPYRASLWWLSLHWWFWSTGERTEATLDLMREHIELDRQIARVPASIRKGRLKPMTYWLPPRLCELLAEMNQYPSESGRVFERQFGASAFYHRYRRLVTGAGLPTPRGDCGPQKFRITVLSMIKGRGGDPTDFAKHSSPAVTEAYIDEALVMAMKAGEWPPKDVNPEKPAAGPTWRRWLRISG
jgi:integrase